MIDHRKKLTISIPVESTDRYEFCRRSGEDDFWDNCEQLSEFISIALMEKGICTPRGSRQFPDKDFKEIIKNCYDAFASRDLKLGDKMLLTVVIQEKSDEIVIKIKDNGPGFIEQPKNIFFNLETIKPQIKNSYGVCHRGFFGGKGIGLRQFTREIQDLGGHVKFKNRKEVGATVFMFFKIPPDVYLNEKTDQRLSQIKINL
ncbi:MAG: ATP-binding protein [Gammaproteobacteria bacterium]|nr:ATP-binding protein [Gammaproteobacteria bacterium]